MDTTNTQHYIVINYNDRINNLKYVIYRDNIGYRIILTNKHGSLDWYASNLDVAKEQALIAAQGV